MSYSSNRRGWDESHKLSGLRNGLLGIAAPSRSKHPDEGAFCLRPIVCLLVHLFELLKAGFPGRMESDQRPSGDEAWVDFQGNSKFLDRFPDPDVLAERQASLIVLPRFVGFRCCRNPIVRLLRAGRTGDRDHRDTAVGISW